ncbi:MAG: AAA family ATPase [Gammaproteobacteria bacterium]|nr:AAA family ATPase [Gammaproteobacteria bacterium]
MARALDSLNRILLGKADQVRLALCALVARGHLLIEDGPGVGKTILANALARVLGLDYRRIQFTADLLPADITGVSIYDAAGGGFRFHPGPVFAQVVLADEINRATPKAQSALLEAMEESQITADGTTHNLPAPFFVIATQNPRHQIGTFPLPESQLDRFLLRLELGYPQRDAERELLAGEDRREMLARLEPACDPAAVQAAQRAASRLTVSAALLDYLQDLLAATRGGDFGAGLSPRAGRQLLAVARAHAFLAGRLLVLPEDVQAVFAAVAGHRMHAAQGEETASVPALRRLLESVPVP